MMGFIKEIHYIQRYLYKHIFYVYVRIVYSTSYLSKSCLKHGAYCLYPCPFMCADNHKLKHRTTITTTTIETGGVYCNLSS